jgi:hypothetical protein
MPNIQWHHKRRGSPIIYFAMAFASDAWAVAPPPIHAIEIHSPRDYAIVMGETVAGEIIVRTEPGIELETSSLPLPGSAASEYLELREIAWSKQLEYNAILYRISLTYQIFKGVRDAETVTVPALPLRFQQAGLAIETQAPAWDFTLLPIIPAKIPDEAVSLRGDLPVPIYADTGHVRWFWSCLTGLLGLSLYACGYLGLFSRRRPPFISAARAIKKLNKQPPSLDTWQQGAKLLHAALNETAGHPVFSCQLEYFIADYYHDIAYKLELVQFFVKSDRLFFGEEADYPSDFPLSRLETLCRKLATASVKK